VAEGVWKWEGKVRASGGQKSSCVVQGQSPGGDLGAKPSQAEAI